MQVKARVKVFALLPVLLGLCGCSLGEDKVEIQVKDETCSDYCAATYPEHTYPDPDDHCACTRGCRMAVMDALMSWPFAPKRSFCLSTCKEAYGSDGHFYACQTGCNVTTIYQKVPNSDQIYQSSSTGGSPELGIVMEMLQAISKQLPNDDQMEKLTQQAESMYRLLPGGARVSTFVIIQENDGSVEVEYGKNIFDERLENTPEEEEDGEVAAATYRVSCPWNYTTSGRLLSLVGVGLMLVAILTCCCSGLLSDEDNHQEEEVGTKKKESYRMSVKEKLMMSPQLKAPPTYSLGYPQPLPLYKSSTLL